MPKQPKHTRVIGGNAVIVNPDMPAAKSSFVEPGRTGRAEAAVGLEGLAEEITHGQSDYHLADVKEAGIHVEFVGDDDGGGIVFLSESYLVGAPSVLDGRAEDALERDLMQLAQDAGLGGIEVIGNRLQWIKVYDAEGHPIGQNGYVSEEQFEALDVFHENLSCYGDFPDGGDNV